MRRDGFRTACDARRSRRRDGCGCDRYPTQDRCHDKDSARIEAFAKCPLKAAPAAGGHRRGYAISETKDYVVVNSTAGMYQGALPG